MSSKGAGTVTGEQDQQSRLVPALRFPEFRDADGWEFKTLNHLLSEPKQRNRNLKYGPGDVLSVSGEYGCVNQIEFMGRSYAGVSVKDYHVVETGDVVYTKSPLKVAPFGIIKANKGRSGIVSTLYAVYRPTANARADYIDHYFSRNYNLNSYLQPIVKKGAKNDMKVKNSDVLTGSVWVPKIDEQKKIADCLSSIDTLIAAEADKLEALKDHKKGLMQQLFPAPGETTPRLRFSEFQDAGEWKWKTVNEIASLHKGKGISKADIAADGYQPCIRYGELYTVYGEVIENVLSKTNVAISELFISKKNDVIIPSSGETKIDIATASCVMCDGIALGGDLNVIRSRVNGVFISYFLNGPLKHEIAKVAQGDSVVHLYPTQIGMLKVAVPTENEQQKIADFLSTIDTLITAQAAKIDALKVHKQGLMQQLFPVSAEVKA